MSKLHVESLRMPAVQLGPENPLPPLHPLDIVTARLQVDASVPEAARQHLGYGCNTSLLPYRLQDDYDRHLTETDLRVAVLENEILRAVFLLDFGGRLYSLIHKPSGRELLHVNPVLQLTNFAARNAWFAGGVEWNVSINGHCPFTCSPLFTARVCSNEGYPVLRFYEWERLRGVPFQIDCSLPPGSPWLFVQVRIINPHEATIPMYWWSNMAVPENEDVRVLAPAEAGYFFGYAQLMQRIPVPWFADRDISYATNWTEAADYFYELADNQRPWITALDSQGCGLIQTSTMRLHGRKLFVMGMAPGGRHWLRFLSDRSRPYMELQAGLARTQYECLPMPPRDEWTWLEAYGLMDADPAVVHGPDWSAARADVAKRLEQSLPANWLEAEWERRQTTLNRPPDEILHQGSGWGALESRRCAVAGEKADQPGALVFDEASLGEEQAPWIALLETGELPYRPPTETPSTFLVQPQWRDLLETSVAQGKGDHWLSWLHVGIMRYDAGDIDEARQAWEHSLTLEPSAWALRNLAVLARDQECLDRAADLWLQAHKLLPYLRPLAVECAQALLAAHRPQDVLDWFTSLSPSLRDQPRMQYLKARAELETGQLDRVEEFIQSGIVIHDMREGELSLTDLWFSLHEKRLAEVEGSPVTDAIRQRVREQFPPPEHIDFRMSG